MQQRPYDVSHTIENSQNKSFYAYNMFINSWIESEFTFLRSFLKSLSRLIVMKYYVTSRGMQFKCEDGSVTPHFGTPKCG
jgi:hypothetical protein